MAELGGSTVQLRDRGALRNGLWGRNFACALLALAVLLGGTQTSATFYHLGIELAAMALLIRLLFAPPTWLFAAHKPALILLAATFVLISVQLIPLPPNLWSGLAGREVSLAIATVIEKQDAWRPLTIDSSASSQALLALLPFAAMFLCTLQLNPQARKTLAVVLIAGASVSLALSFVQVGAAPGAWRLYGGTHDHLPVGLFANRNHQADLLLLAILFSAALIRSLRWERWQRWLAWLCLAAVFAAGVVATNSRAGLSLLPIALLGSIVVLLPRASDLRRSFDPRLAIAFGSLTLAIGTFIALSGAMGSVLGRFETARDVRSTIWPETVYAASKYLPLGSGAGTFDTVYRSIEDLNYVSPMFVNHAHNDFLEIWLELGVPGVILIGAFVALFVKQLLTSVSVDQRPLHYAAAAGIAILFLHSLFDYPVRTYSLMVALGYMCGLLFPPAATVGTGVRLGRNANKLSV